MSFSSNESRPLRRSQSLPHLASREDSGVGLSGSGSCNGINNAGYMTPESSNHSSHLLHHHHQHLHHHHHHKHRELKIPYGTRLVADLRQLMTLRQHYYPEGGWGWLLTFIGLTIQCISHGLHMSSGILINEMTKMYGSVHVTAGDLIQFNLYFIERIFIINYH